WSPIRVNEKMNYQHSDSSYISHTIWVDSAFSVGGDSIFYLNRIVKDVPGNPEIVLRNQPQFLFERMDRDIFGLYSFLTPGQYMSITLAGVGDTWTFDPVNGIGATVSEISYEEVFGVMDSVKQINLSDGNEIRLSQNFGILKFPDFENGGYYNLVGIQGTEYGESVPGFWEIYDFEVGDVYQLSREMWLYFGSGNETRKITITQKTITNEGYDYTFDGIFHGVYMEMGGGTVESYTYNGTLNFQDSASSPTNYFPNQLYQLRNAETSFGTGKVLTQAKIFMDDETVCVKKEFGSMEESFTPFGVDVYYETNEDNDSLYRLEYVTIVDDPCGRQGIGFGSNIGQTYMTEGCFEYKQKDKLVGYIKDGDTVGIITPDSLLHTGISSFTTHDPEFIVYPNPANQHLTIHFTTEEGLSNYRIEIRNMLGDLIMNKESSQKVERLDISQLSPGIYFYSILLDNKVYQTDKLIVY
ncbi:MAG: T9SS type A sorting domain-containing protein, partial [Bacteroidales bacterium]